MADQLQRLRDASGRRLRAAALLFSLATCQCITGADFSHRPHLEKKIPCATCHTSATNSTNASENNLPASTICANCHKDRSASIAPPSPLLVTKFNHQLHAKLGNVGPVIARALQSGTHLGNLSPEGQKKLLQDLEGAQPCGACHRGMERSVSRNPEHFPEMADCLVCHNRIDPPFSCAKCHDPGPHLKPSTHTADWLERHSRRGILTDRQSCAECHGKQFTCLGCH